MITNSSNQKRTMDVKFLNTALRGECPTGHTKFDDYIKETIDFSIDPASGNYREREEMLEEYRVITNQMMDIYRSSIEKNKIFISEMKPTCKPANERKNLVFLLEMMQLSPACKGAEGVLTDMFKNGIPIRGKAPQMPWWNELSEERKECNSIKKAKFKEKYMACNKKVRSQGPSWLTEEQKEI